MTLRSTLSSLHEHWAWEDVFHSLGPHQALQTLLVAQTSGNTFCYLTSPSGLGEIKPWTISIPRCWSSPGQQDLSVYRSRI